MPGLFYLIALLILLVIIPFTILIILITNPCYFFFPFYKLAGKMADNAVKRRAYYQAITLLLFTKWFGYYGPKLYMKAAKIYNDYVFEYDECIKICDVLIYKNQELKDAYFYKALALERSGKRDEAAEFYIASEDRYPYNSVVNYRLAWIYHEMDNSAWRDYYLNRALHCIEGKTADMYNLSGNILFKKGDFANAIKQYMIGSTDHEEIKGPLYLNIANAYRKSGNLEEARFFLHRASDLIPDNVDYLFGLSEYYKDSGDLNKSNEILEEIKGMGIDPGYRCIKDGVPLHNTEYYDYLHPDQKSA